MRFPRARHSNFKVRIDEVHDRFVDGPFMRSTKSEDNSAHGCIASFIRLLFALYGVLRGTPRPLCLL